MAAARRGGTRGHEHGGILQAVDEPQEPLVAIAEPRLPAHLYTGAH